MRSLLSRKTWSRHWTILSNSLDRNDRFDTGRKFFKTLASRPLFLSSGRITACLNSDGKYPEASDLLNSNERNGDTSPRTSFTNHVGTGSSWHVLFGAEPMSLSISSAVTAVHSLSNGVVLYGTSYRGVAAVDAHTDATLSLKKVAKSSAVCSVVSSARDSPRTP